MRIIMICLMTETVWTNHFCNPWGFIPLGFSEWMKHPLKRVKSLSIGNVKKPLFKVRVNVHGPFYIEQKKNTITEKWVQTGNLLHRKLSCAITGALVIFSNYLTKKFLSWLAQRITIKNILVIMFWQVKMFKMFAELLLEGKQLRIDCLSR